MAPAWPDKTVIMNKGYFSPLKNHQNGAVAVVD
jgi:hypothetical protein